MPSGYSLNGEADFAVLRREDGSEVAAFGTTGADPREVRMIGNLKLKMFAALVLRAMAREQAEEGTEWASPRDPGVAGRLGLEPDSPALAAAERYLALKGYIEPCSPDHEDGPFTITELGRRDLGYQPSAEGGWRRRPWWKRMLGV